MLGAHRPWPAVILSQGHLPELLMPCILVLPAANASRGIPRVLAVKPWVGRSSLLSVCSRSASSLRLTILEGVGIDLSWLNRRWTWLEYIDRF